MTAQHTSSASSFLSSSEAEVAAALALSKLQYPTNPFHDGEIQFQIAAGKQEHVMSYAPKFLRSFMPDQHREFYQELPFLVAAIRDKDDNMWATLLERTTTSGTLVTSSDPTILDISATPSRGDALYGALKEGAHVGILGIQLETARRNRVNGRIGAVKSGDGFVLAVDQSFGNCPQYIRTRESWYRAVPSTTKHRRSFRLSKEQIDRIQSTETLFTASGYEERGGRHENFHGNDASHRGGKAGFVRVTRETDINGHEKQYVVWTEYAGNNHYNTLGNLLMDPRIGIAIADFESGGLLQISGRAEIASDSTGAFQVKVAVETVNEMLPGSLPIRWPREDSENSDGKMQLVVTNIVQESESVKSFYLKHLESNTSNYSFDAGQYLPVDIALPSGQDGKRRYSLSSYNTPYYRISVKKEPHGAVSTFLHESIKTGDIVVAGNPVGDFRLAQSTTGKTIVLISSGIGITPVISMLNKLAQGTGKTIVWIHGARNGRQHNFKDEANLLLQKARSNKNVVQSRIFYSQPDAHDIGYDVAGRIKFEAIASIVDSPDASFFMCGPPSFIADIQEMLDKSGVPDTNIQFESF